ncbi:DUF1684 domain-containing protein [Kribbella sp. HUAS MG21]|uniref:DUF1684 domain-containing protein n=1 Tax=Kribbella sp. HUAS MG21 TaxID=3160966 RepID=A0AAU7TE47_9ACTN
MNFESFRAEWEAWRAGWEQWLTRPHGWLSAVALNWLDETPRRYPGIPGRWWQKGTELLVDPACGRMTFDGVDFTSTRVLNLADGPDDQRVTAGELEIGITYSGGYHLITYDPNAPARQNFAGVAVFDPDPAFVITGHFQAEPRELSLGTVGSRDQAYESPGTVRFEYGGAPYDLRVTMSNGRQVAVFADATSGARTYPAGRALDIPAAAADGRVTLDFNRAVNLPCAFGDFFPTCPTPPAGNRYPFAIEAGEQSPV